ncbi:hypothetical protein AJ80_00892 [Polytolypa hystricis UAMH7299]|uniref:NmrA-like domain-containing protein n=1 Tax=Polytolypa hystricis (strain UAMH7299) TaxID=1447883 RepID=A0A2B7YTP3_POLH7|nr:hypothetical protein AJ80_00892 [Polytolypa hystricis UAMH7299]
MSQAFKNIVVVGGGLVGSALIQALLDAPEGYSVSVLLRESSEYNPPAGVSIIKSDFTNESLVKAFSGQDVVASTIAPAALPDQIKLIDAAIEAGVKRFIPSEYAGDTRIKAIHPLIPFSVFKFQVFEHLVKNQDKIEWTVFATGAFVDVTLKTGFLGFDIANTTAKAWDDKYADATFSATRLPTVAKVVAQSLSPSLAPKTANQYIFVREATLSLRDLLSALEKATGSTFTRNDVDFASAAEEGLAKLSRGDVSGLTYIVISYLINPQSATDFDAAGVVSNHLFDLPEVELQSIVDEVVAEVKNGKEA